MSAAALSSPKAAAAECATRAVGFHDEAAADFLAAVKLARTRGGGSAASAGVPPDARQAIAADQAPLTLLLLPAEVLVIVFGRLDARSLARLAGTSSVLSASRSLPWRRRCGSTPRRAAACARTAGPRASTRWQRISSGSSAGATRCGRPLRLVSRASSLWRMAAGS
jgi:hypothetical protein